MKTKTTTAKVGLKYTVLQLYGYCNTVEKLINAKSSRLELITLDKKQVTPLWLVFRGGHFETANLLLSLGAKTDVTDTRNIRIIEIAVKKEQYKFLLQLIMM